MAATRVTASRELYGSATEEPTMGATVLVVDDESMIRELYVAWLSDDHEVRTAADGAAALSAADDAVDVVLLDRRMPGTRGDEVLRTLRERGVDCRVVMASAVDPGVDVVDLPFDDYLVKPAEADRLLAAVERTTARSRLDPVGRAYLAAVAKLGLVEGYRGTVADEAIEELRERVVQRRAALNGDVDWADDPAAHEQFVLSVPETLPVEE
jgi:DNA-binding response OmpR family regulator